MLEVFKVVLAWWVEFEVGIGAVPIANRSSRVRRSAGTRRARDCGASGEGGRMSL
jgi:hypothetical protein